MESHGGFGSLYRDIQKVARCSGSDVGVRKQVREKKKRNPGQERVKIVEGVNGLSSSIGYIQDIRGLHDGDI